MNEIEIKIRWKPIDIKDLLINLFVLAPIVLFLTMAACIGSTILIRMIVSDNWTFLICNIGFLIVMTMVVPAFAVKSIKISDEGIRFINMYGFSKFIVRWTEIKQIIRNITLKERILKAVFSISPGRFYKFVCNNRSYYFSPARENEFEDAIEKYIRIQPIDG